MKIEGAMKYLCLSHALSLSLSNTQADTHTWKHNQTHCAADSRNYYLKSEPTYSYYYTTSYSKLLLLTGPHREVQTRTTSEKSGSHSYIKNKQMHAKIEMFSI